MLFRKYPYIVNHCWSNISLVEKRTSHLATKQSGLTCLGSWIAALIDLSS